MAMPEQNLFKEEHKMAKKMKYNPTDKTEKVEDIDGRFRIYDTSKPISDPVNQEATKKLLENAMFNVIRGGEPHTYTLPELIDFYGNSNLQISDADWRSLEFENGPFISMIHITGSLDSKNFVFKCPSSPMYTQGAGPNNIIESQIDAIYDKDCKYGYMIIMPQGPSIVEIGDTPVPGSSRSMMGIYKYDGIVVLNIYAPGNNHLFVGGRLWNINLERMREFFEISIGKKPIQPFMDSLIKGGN